MNNKENKAFEDAWIKMRISSLNSKNGFLNKGFHWWNWLKAEKQNMIELSILNAFRKRQKEKSEKVREEIFPKALIKKFINDWK